MPLPPAISLVQRAVAALEPLATASATGTEAMIVHVPVAPIVDEPRVSAPQIAQALAGHALTVVARENDWCRVRGGDGYEGWLHVGYLASPSELHIDSVWPGSPTLSLGAEVDGPHGRRRLPLGALLLPGERLVDGDSVNRADLASRFPATAAAIIASAHEYFSGASYQWGGITPWGCDCSGFVQTLLALHGVALSRDARQQVLEGEDVGDEMLAVGAGALHFFSDRADDRITHVGLAAGAGQLLHVSIGRGGFAVEQLDTSDPLVARLRAQWRAARRVLPTV